MNYTRYIRKIIVREQDMKIQKHIDFNIVNT